MQTTFPRLLMQHAAQRPQAPALREKLASFGAQARFMERAVVPA